jgi:hypothetical protein
VGCLSIAVNTCKNVGRFCTPAPCQLCTIVWPRPPTWPFLYANKDLKPSATSSPAFVRYPLVRDLPYLILLTCVRTALREALDHSSTTSPAPALEIPHCRGVQNVQQCWRIVETLLLLQTPISSLCQTFVVVWDDKTAIVCPSLVEPSYHLKCLSRGSRTRTTHNSLSRTIPRIRVAIPVMLRQGSTKG